MILAAGLTPAWQRVYVVDGLRLGEVNRARETVACGSGKVLNVGLGLHHLGGGHRTLALLGGVTGEAIAREFALLGASCRWVRSSGGTRVCTTLLDVRSGTTTELVENAAPIGPADLDAFERAYEQEARGASLVVLSGSLPAGTPPEVYRDLLDRTPGRAILDVRGDDLLEALSRRPFLVKPNREELGTTLGRRLASRAEVLEGMAEINRRGAEWVVVTAGKGDVLARSERETLVLGTLEVPPVNPIGCGDCLAAGTAWALQSGDEMPAALAFGIACAAQNAAALLPGRLEEGRAREMARRVTVERRAGG